jgi:hypothetical protein
MWMDYSYVTSEGKRKAAAAGTRAREHALRPPTAPSAAPAGRAKRAAARVPPHHMLFKGADGVPYEVRGEVGSVFNILSSPRLSINSLFVQVPARFPVCLNKCTCTRASLTPRVWWTDAGRGRYRVG